MMGVGFNDDGQVQGIFDRLEEDYDEDVPTAPLKRSRKKEIQWSEEFRNSFLFPCIFLKRHILKRKLKWKTRS
jgi:hypothetical protein